MIQANWAAVEIDNSSVSIMDLTLTGYHFGIAVAHCSNTVILGNTFTGNDVGIGLAGANYSQISGNSLTGARILLEGVKPISCQLLHLPAYGFQPCAHTQMV